MVAGESVQKEPPWLHPVLLAELEQVKQVLAKGQYEVTDRMEVLAGAQKEAKEAVLAEVHNTKQEVQETKRGLTGLSAVQHETKQEVQETKEEVQEAKHELTVLAAVQDETKQEVQETKQEVQKTKQRMSALEGKIDSILALLQGSGRSQ
jgi:chromosome segregation ATPase